MDVWLLWVVRVRTVLCRSAVGRRFTLGRGFAGVLLSRWKVYNIMLACTSTSVDR